MIGILEISNRHKSGGWRVRRRQLANLKIEKNIYKQPIRKVEEEASGD